MNEFILAIISVFIAGGLITILFAPLFITDEEWEDVPSEERIPMYCGLSVLGIGIIALIIFLIYNSAFV